MVFVIMVGLFPGYPYNKSPFAYYFYYGRDRIAWLQGDVNEEDCPLTYQQ